MENRPENGADSAESPTIMRFLQAIVGEWLTSMSGAASVVFTVIALLVSLRSAKLVFTTLAIVCAVTASYRVWAAERKALIRVQNFLMRAESTLKMKVQIWKLYLVPLSYVNYKRGDIARFHVFVFAQVELKRPNRISVSSCDLTLERYGHPCNAVYRDDISNWSLTKLSASPIKLTPKSPPPKLDHFSLTAFGSSFQQGIPMDRWMHFTTDDTTEDDLHNSNIRLIVNTPLGSAYDESEDDLWNYDNGETIGKNS